VSVKFLYYVSRSKVRVLSGQVGQGHSLSKLGAKASALGFGVEFASERESAQDDETQLARELTDLLRRLRKSSSIVSLKPGEPLEGSPFYHDSGDWHHGLYSIKMTGDAEQTTTYLAWKADQSRIFLLFGSPINVVGVRDVSDGTEFALASSRIVGDVVESSLQWEFMRELQECDERDPDEVFSVERDPRETSRVGSSIQRQTHPKLIKADVNELRGSALAVFCETALQTLPLTKLETVFKVYHALPVSRAIASYDHVYVGSPVYTALE
jgi:hypothetical protein